MNSDRYAGAKEALAKIKEFCLKKANEEREASSSYAVINAYENVMHHALDLLSEAMDEWDADMRKSFTQDKQ